MTYFKELDLPKSYQSKNADGMGPSMARGVEGVGNGVRMTQATSSNSSSNNSGFGMLMIIFGGITLIGSKALFLILDGITSVKRYLVDLPANAKRGNFYDRIEMGRREYRPSTLTYVSNLIRGRGRERQATYVRTYLNNHLKYTTNKNKINNLKNNMVRLALIPPKSYTTKNITFMQKIINTNKNNQHKPFHNTLLNPNKNGTSKMDLRVKAYTTLIVKLLIIYLKSDLNNPNTKEHLYDIVLSLLVLYFILVPTKYSNEEIQKKSVRMLNMCIQTIKEHTIIVSSPRPPPRPNNTRPPPRPNNF